MCVFLSVRRTVEGTDPVLSGPEGRSVFEGVTQRIAAVTETCRPLDLERQPPRHCGFHVIDSFLTHTYWCYLNQSRYFAKKPPSEGRICIAKVSVCLHVWMHNRTWMCNSDLTWLSWKVSDWNMIKFSFFLESWTAHFTAVGHPDRPQVRETPT